MCKTKGSPKGSMVEGYALEEALGFYTKYLVDLQPCGVRYGMTKKTHACLMKYLKAMGIHEL